MKNYYITGIAGFVGRNLLRILEKEDVRIIGFILPQEDKYNWLHKPNITLVKGNILNIDDIKSFLTVPSEGEKILIHAAGRVTTMKNGDPLTFDINYQGSKNVVDAVNEIGDFNKVIYVSSVDALPKRNDKEDIYEVDKYDEYLVDGVYSKSKALATNYVIENCHAKCVVVLPSAIMGPDDPNNAPINNAINKCIKGKLPAITAGGYNLVDVRDVAEGIINACTYGKDKTSYILSGTYVSVKDLIKLTCELSNRKMVKLKIPHFLIKMISPFIELHAKRKNKIPLFTGFSMDCLMQNSFYNHSKASKEIKYHPRPLIETVRDTIDWLNNPQLD